MKTKAKRQGSKSPTTSTNAIVGHPGAPVAAAIEALRVAADNLYDAVLTLPFGLTDELPGHEGDVAGFVAQCERWHDNAVAMFNAASSACQNPVANGLPLLSIIGTPEFGDTTYTTPHTRHFDSRFMAAFRVRCEREDKAHPIGLPVRDHQARCMVLSMQLRGRAFTRWLHEAIDRHGEMTLPRITIIEGAIRSHTARVEMAGARRDRKIQDKQRDALVALATMEPVDLTRADVRTKLIDAVPELDGLILTVDASTGNAWYRLDPRMAGRIK